MDRIHAIEIASSIARDTRKAARDRLAALAWLTDRAYGKPTPPLPGEEAEPAGTDIKVSYVEARLADHPQWPGFEGRVATALSKYPQAAHAAKAVLADEASSTGAQSPDRNHDGLEGR